MKRQKSAISHQLSVIRNEKGIALVMVMILSLIALATMSGLIYMVTSGTQVSGIQKRYTTALEAGKAGTEVTYSFIGFRGVSDLPVSLIKTPTEPCLSDKLNKPTSDWSGCDKSLTIESTDDTTYDMNFNLGPYRVYTKIVDTVEGNSSADEGLIKSGVVSSNTGEVAVMSIPYLYTIEVDAQSTANPAERAKLSILYQY